MTEPWHPAESPDEQEARKAAYQRLADAARRVGMPLERLAQALRSLEDSEVATRRFLAEEVYGVPDELLDDLVRVRLADLAAEEERGPGG